MGLSQFLSSRWISKQCLYFCRPKITRSIFTTRASISSVTHLFLACAFPLSTPHPRACAESSMNLLTLSWRSGDYIIFRTVLLQHSPLHLHIVTCMTDLVGLLGCRYISTVQVQHRFGQGPELFFELQCLSPSWTLVVKQDTIASVHSVGLPIIHSYPVGV